VPGFFNFQQVEIVRIGTGAARIVEVMHRQLRYIDGSGADCTIDLEDCARIAHVLYNAGLFPPADDTDWAKLAAGNPDFLSLDVSLGCVGLRGVIDDPPWFQFLDRRRTQFEFNPEVDIRNDLLRPLATAGWQTWDAS
jgi:hypothetical protein